MLAFSHRLIGCGPRAQLPLLLVIILFGLLAQRLLREKPLVAIFPNAPEKTAQGRETVALHIDYGNGVEKHFLTLSWHKEMTVLDVFREAARQTPGIGFSYRGQTKMAMLTEIDGLKNEGGQTNARNWIYRVNGQKADKSFAVYRLQPSDVVLWTFGAYE